MLSTITDIALRTYRDITLLEAGDEKLAARIVDQHAHVLAWPDAVYVPVLRASPREVVAWLDEMIPDEHQQQVLFRVSIGSRRVAGQMVETVECVGTIIAARDPVDRNSIWVRWVLPYARGLDYPF